MCDTCTRNRAELLKEISGLTHGTGELYDGLKETIWEQEPDDGLREDKLIVVVAQSIAIRTAFLAKFTHGVEESGLQPSLILGVWAGFCLNIEMEKAQRDEIVETLLKHINFN